MDTFLIKKILKSFKCFKGVYASDKLPYNKSLPLNIIVNTDPSYEKGEHWVAISIDKKGKGYYFDSFGLPPLKEHIFKFINEKSTKSWDYNKLCIQNYESITCGHYCVTYIIFKCQNLSNEIFLQKFNANTLQNDKRMLTLFRDFSLVDKI